MNIYSKEKSKIINENKNEENNIQIPNLNLLEVKKSEIKQKLETKSPIIFKIKLVDPKPKPSFIKIVYLINIKELLIIIMKLKKNNFKSYSPNVIR